MLQTLFGFLQRFQMPIMIVVGMAGIACSLTSNYLKTEISVAYCKKLFIFLDVVSLVFIFINMILLFMLVFDVFRSLLPYVFQMGF